MTWSSNNQAHHWTWKILIGLDLITETKSFEATGKLKITQLRHWVSGEAKSTRRTKCRLLAAQFDGLCVNLIHAEYEAASTKEKARSAIQAILMDAEQLVSDLGEKVDSLYHFPLE